MDEYIKKSDAVDVIVKYPYNIAGKTATAIKMIEDLPRADVVPKSEVDKMLIGKANSLTAKFILEDQEARSKALMAEHDSKLASEIFAEIDKNFILISIYDIGFEELKKKYTEGEE